VLVFVDKLDAATARCIQYARTLTPDELRAVHFVIEDAHGAELAEQWRRLGLQRVPLELVACPDRRLTRAAVECVARELADQETEVSVLLPERKYKGVWHRILHDKTGDAIQEQVSKLAHANVTSVPFHFGTKVAARQSAAGYADVVNIESRQRTLELVLVDDTGALSVVFLGRRSLAGVDVGSRMVVTGTVGVHKARLALLNPTYRLVV
jgi:hypothetical protein